MDKLVINVTAYTGPDMPSGLVFKYFPADLAASTSGYLDDTSGNITLPPNTSTEIVFQLITAKVTWPNAGKDFSITLGANPLKIWQPTTGKWPHPTGAWPMGVFSAPKVIGNTISTTAVADAKEYEYSLSVDVKFDNGKVTTLTVDPRIRNGGDGLPAAYGPSSVLLVAGGVLLAVAALVLWRFVRPQTA